MVLRKTKFYQFGFINQWHEIETPTIVYGHYKSIKKLKYYYRGVRVNKNNTL